MASASLDESRVAELSFLTGPLAGTKTTINGRSAVGPDASCDTTLQCDHEIGRVEIFFEKDAWWIASTSSCKVVHNHQVVDGKTQLRSGDIIRLSHDGPDFVFSIGSTSTSAGASTTPIATATDSTGAMAATQTMPPATPAAAGPAPLPANEANEAIEVAPKSQQIWLWMVPILVATVVIVTTLNMQKAEEGTFREIQEQEIIEGHRWQLPLSEYYDGNSEPAYRLVDPILPGLTLDGDLLVWEPVVPRDAGSHSVQVEALGRDEQQIATAKIELFVRMTQRSIRVALPGELNATAGKPFAYQLEAAVEGRPQQALAYEVTKPEGATITKDTGLLQWVPSKELIGTTQSIHVAITGDNAAPSEVVVHVTVERGPLTKEEIAEHSTYLVVAEEPQTGTLFPFAVSCAVRTDSLLTTGVIAEELVRARKKGWKLSVQNVKSQKWEDIVDVRVAAPYAASADEPADQLYVDFGVLKVAKDDTRPVIPLSPPGVGERGMPLTCLGFDNEGEPLTRFDHKELLKSPAKIYMITRLPIGDTTARVEGPGLLHLTGKLPENAYGSPLLDQESRLLGVYVEKAEIPEDHELARLRGRYHYAARAGWLRSWVDSGDEEAFVVPEPKARPAPEDKEGASDPPTEDK